MSAPTPPPNSSPPPATTPTDSSPPPPSPTAFAHLCGTAPINASSGRTTRHRLNRGGDRHANAALYRIVIVRLRYCPQTQAYLAKRTTEGLSKRDTIRCLKRYVAREIYNTIHADLTNLTNTP